MTVEILPHDLDVRERARLALRDIPPPTMEDVLLGIHGWVEADRDNHFADYSEFAGVVKLTASVRGCRKPVEFLFSRPERGILIRNRIRAAFRAEETLADAIERIELDTE